MTDPFCITGPTCLNVSGGRTSAYMWWRTLRAHGGRLPPDVHVVFCNTGKERTETLDFVRECMLRWGSVVWLERDGSAEPGARFREVEYESASRNGEPFAELITEKRFLPNKRVRTCTVALKIEPARDYMRAQGYRDDWTSVIGFRRDERPRVSKLRARDIPWSVAFPLYDARITKADVTAFWAAQPFDLQLKPYESNCDLCFFKTRAVRERLMRERPEMAAWWIEQETRIGATFHYGEKGYAAQLDRVRRLPLLPMDLDPAADEDTGMPCGCTDRRAPRRRTCTCRKKPGQGHALTCVRVMGKEAA